MAKLKFKDGGMLLPFDRPKTDWMPEMPPDLCVGDQIGFDFEFKPGRNPTKDKPFAYSIYVPSLRRGWFLPWACEGGGNLPEHACRSWLLKNIKSRPFHGLNLKAEVHQMLNWNIDIDALDLQPRDAAFGATLLDENRISGFSLEALAEEYLPIEDRKIHPTTIDPQHFYLAHSSEIAERGISDSYLAWRIHEETWPKILEEQIEVALALENRVITAVVDMERNGALIDRSKLEQWNVGLDAMISDLTLKLYSDYGVRVNPDSRDDMRRLFKTCGIPFEAAVAWVEDKMTKIGSYEQNFSEEALDAAYKKTHHPVLPITLRLRKLKSLQSKYFIKYLAKLDENNILRYTLHQLRGDSTGELKGTVTGRFSCGGGRKDYPDHIGINIQQVPKAEDQIETLGPNFIVRELFISETGMCGASDASQIEFRIFAHCSRSKPIIEAYKKDPMTDFHMLVTKIFRPDLIGNQEELDSERKHKKHQNFGKIYRLGRAKLARKLGKACNCEEPSYWYEKKTKIMYDGSEREVYAHKFGDNDEHDSECPARVSNDISDEYDRQFPEAGEVCQKYEGFAKKNGYVCTMLKRRRHFPGGVGIHRAFNSVDQGSAAEIFKTKMADLYQERKTLEIKLRMPVHDEFVYDHNNTLHLVQELLDTQSFPLTVPILWESGTGPNWKRANLSEVKELKAIAKYERSKHA